MGDVRSEGGWMEVEGAREGVERHVDHGAFSLFFSSLLFPQPAL